MPPESADLAALQAILDPLLPGLLGVRLLAAEPDRVVGELDVRPDLCTTGGVLHGGACMAFADTLGAVGTFVTLPPGSRTTTTDSSTKFIAAAPVHGTVTGEAVALHRGRTTQVWQTTIKRADGKLCAVVMQTQLIISNVKE
jgi:1,4-dihydroxy-2-naphthoyl-CoA hydrolase